MTTLLHVILVRLESDAFGADVFAALRKAFGASHSSQPVTSPFGEESVWSQVRLVEITRAEEVESLNLSPIARAVWIVLTRSGMTSSDSWKSALRRIFQWLDAAPFPDGANPLLLFSSSEALQALPELQARETGTLGEHRIAPHRLALLALHRARLLLGREAGARQKLRLFISHAKADGVFFADAIRHAISQITELEFWYDATDIESGAVWRNALRDNARSSILIALRTDAYTSRPACIEEFQCALEAGVPIVVVDALTGSEITPCSLPLSAVPTVRVQDGNTFRVLAAALREHVRVLLVETRVAEQCLAKAPSLPPSAWRIWPRLPGYHAIQATLSHHAATTPCCIVVADSAGPEISAAAEMLQRLRRADGSHEPIVITTAEMFGDLAVILAAQYQNPPIQPV